MSSQERTESYGQDAQVLIQDVQVLILCQVLSVGFDALLIKHTVSVGVSVFSTFVV